MNYGVGFVMKFEVKDWNEQNGKWCGILGNKICDIEIE